MKKQVAVPQDGLQAWVYPALEAEEIPLEVAMSLHAQVFAFFTRFFGWVEATKKELGLKYKEARHKPEARLPKAVVAFAKGDDHLWREVVEWGQVQAPPWTEAEYAQAVELRNRLVENYLRLALAEVLAGRLGGYEGDEVLDLLAEASLALVEGVMTYDPCRSKVRPEVYLVQVVRSHLGKTKGKKGREHLDARSLVLVQKLSKARDEIHARGEVADVPALLKETKLSPEELELALQAEQPLLRTSQSSGSHYQMVDLAPEHDSFTLAKTIGQVVAKMHEKDAQAGREVEAFLANKANTLSPKARQEFQNVLAQEDEELWGYMDAFHLAAWVAKALGRKVEVGSRCQSFEDILNSLDKAEEAAIRNFLNAKPANEQALAAGRKSLLVALEQYPLAKSYFGGIR